MTASVLAAADTTPIKAPSIAYHALWPIFIVLGAACLGVLVEAFVRRNDRFPVQVGLTSAALLGALIDVFALHGTSLTTAGRALAVDGVGLFLQGSILILALMSVLLIAERSVEGSPIVA